MADNRICCVANCGKPVKNKMRGWCVSHYKRYLRHGDPSAGGLPKGAAATRLRETLKVHASDDCLLWPFGKTPSGYGVIMLNRRLTYVHVYACEYAHGEKPSDAHEVAHGCGKPACYNPKHLRWALHIENLADQVAHGTRMCGVKNPLSKLTEDDVRAIRALRGQVSQSKLAKRFGVSQTAVWAAQSGRYWRHV